MPQLFIVCPETGNEVYTGLNMDWFDFDAIELGEQSFKCPRCHQMHTWTKNDATLRSDGAGD